MAILISITTRAGSGLDMPVVGSWLMSKSQEQLCQAVNSNTSLETPKWESLKEESGTWCSLDLREHLHPTVETREVHQLPL
jgi:hypothetical protein